MSQSATITETDILADVIDAEHGNLSPDVAEAVLQWRFSQGALARMNELADRNNKGMITPDEREDLEKYLRVGSLVNLLQAKARLSLKSSRSSAD